ncbi:MAG: TonB-dependent receptor [Bacteroidota bacterium]
MSNIQETTYRINAVLLSGMILFLGLPQVGIFAQNGGSAIAESDSIPWSIDIDDIVVTAQYTPAAVEQTTHRVVTIQAEEIERQGYNTLSEAVNQQLNLQVGVDPILGNGLSIQGIGGQNIQILIDGVPMVGRLGGDIDLTQVSLENVARIEIIPGSMSARYGSNAAGGVINLISKKTQPDEWRVDISGQLESVGIERRSAIVGRQIGRLQFDVGYRDLTTDIGKGSTDTLRAMEEVELPDGEIIDRKVVPWNPKQQEGWHANLQFQLGSEGLLRYGYDQFDEELTIFGEVTSRIRPNAIDETFNTQRRSHSLHYTDWIDWGRSGKLYLESTLGFNEFDRTSVEERTFLEADSTIEVPNSNDTTLYRGILHRTILSTRTNRNWDFQLGVEFLSESGSGGRIEDITDISGEAPNLVGISSWIGGRYELPGTKLRLEGTLRAGYDSRNANYPLVPAINMFYNLRDRWQLRVGYSHGFRTPSVQELYFRFIDNVHFILGNPDLSPEFSRHLEASVDGELTRNTAWNLNVNARGFYNRIRNQIGLAEFDFARFRYENIDTLQTHGFNLGFQLTDGSNRFSLDGGFGLTFREFTIAGEEVNLDSKFGTLIEMQNQMRYRIPWIEVDLSIQHRHIGRQERLYYDDEGVIRIGTVQNFDLINTSLSRRFWNDKLLINIGIKNLLDVQRIRTSGQTGGVHSGGSGSRLVDFGRNYFVRLGFNL